MTTIRVPLVDLQAGYLAQKEVIDAAIAGVLFSGWYILGDETRSFEEEFAAFMGANHAVGVASGTDALLLSLRALQIGPGDEVITVAHSAVATAAAIVLSGATPVFIDVNPRYFTMDPDLIERAISERTKAIIPVHLYGHPADMDRIGEIARAHQLWIVEDCAQAHGARIGEQLVGSFGEAGAFSFYPTKNLGAIGDGGAVICREPLLADRLRSLRQYGWRKRYVSEEVGDNSRLDELQAAVLRAKLRNLDQDNERRRRCAALYAELLDGCPIQLPQEFAGYRHVYHLYVIQSGERDDLRRFLHEQGMGTAIHYPLPIHLQPAYEPLGYLPGSLPQTEELAATILSLPMFPQIREEQVHAVASAIRAFYAA
jgi:dTDP-4-amino-4,6-dideoxygalactose transaminase